MRVLILIAHADTFGHSASHHLAFAARDELLSDGHEVRLIELSKVGFIQAASTHDFVEIKDPDNFHYVNQQEESNLTPEILEQQANVRWCTHLVIFGPMWFFRYPACFYAYFERVFTCGFGYTTTQYVTNGPMKGKFALCVITCGNKPLFIDPVKGLGSIEALFYHTLSGHLRYCGFSVMRSQTVCEADKPDYPNREPEIIRKWKLAVKNLERRPLIPFYPFGYTNPEGVNEIQMLAGLKEFTMEEAATI